MSRYYHLNFCLRIAGAHSRAVTTSIRTPPYAVEEINYPPPNVITHNDRDYIIVKEVKNKNDFYDDDDSHFIKNGGHKRYNGEKFLCV